MKAHDCIAAAWLYSLKKTLEGYSMQSRRASGRLYESMGRNQGVLGFIDEAFNI